MKVEIFYLEPDALIKYKVVTRSPLGAIRLPLGYHMAKNTDGYWYWTEKRTERTSEVYADRWQCYRDAKKDSERMVEFPTGEEVK